MKRASAIQTIRLAREGHGIAGALVSLRKGVLYARTDD